MIRHFAHFGRFHDPFLLALIKCSPNYCTALRARSLSLSLSHSLTRGRERRRDLSAWARTAEAVFSEEGQTLACLHPTARVEVRPRFLTRQVDFVDNDACIASGRGLYVSVRACEKQFIPESCAGSIDECPPVDMRQWERSERRRRANHSCRRMRAIETSA